MLQLKAHLRLYFIEDIRMQKNVKEKMHFMLQLMISLIYNKGAPAGTLEGAPKDAISNPNKDAQEGSFEVALEAVLLLTAILLPNRQLWAILRGTASLTQ